MTAQVVTHPNSFWILDLDFGLKNPLWLLFSSIQNRESKVQNRRPTRDFGRPINSRAWEPATAPPGRSVTFQMPAIGNFAASWYRNQLSDPNFRLASRRGLTWLESTRLASLPWLVHAWSTRQGGISRVGGSPTDLHGLDGLNLGFVPSAQPARVERNRTGFLRALGAGTFALATLHQVHSADVFEVRLTQDRLEYFPAGAGIRSGSGLPAASIGIRRPKRGPQTAAPEGGPVAQRTPNPETQNPKGCAGDALLTNEPGVLLSVRAADCMPILMVDPRLRAIAAVHAGWRGAARRVVEKSVGEMRRVFGSRARDLLVAIGPCIHACCYEVGEDVMDAFGGRFAPSDRYFHEAPPDHQARALSQKYPLLFLTAKPPGHGPQGDATVHLDLVAVARDQLRATGVPASNIEVSDFCTACHTDLFFSHRKEGETGRTMAVIGIRRD